MSDQDPDVLVIEDIRVFRFPAVYARTLNEAWERLFERPWKAVWWDHDMGLTTDSNNTYALACQLELLAHDGVMLPIEKTYVHSANPYGGDRLMAALKAYNPTRVNANDYLADGQAKLYYVLEGEQWETD